MCAVGGAVRVGRGMGCEGGPWGGRGGGHGVGWPWVCAVGGCHGCVPRVCAVGVGRGGRPWGWGGRGGGVAVGVGWPWAWGDRGGGVTVGVAMGWDGRVCVPWVCAMGVCRGGRPWG